MRKSGSGRWWWVVLVLLFGTGLPLALEAAPERVSKADAVGLPEAWLDEVVAFILLDRFANGDPTNDHGVDPADPADPHAFHGGDLSGLQGRLDYLQDLGITALWVSPLYANRPMRFFAHQAYHGYWPWDFFAVDPRFGTASEAVALREAMRSRGLKLLLDLVVNHMGYDAPLVKALPSWFHGRGEIKDWNDETDRETGSVFGLPDFASEKPVVQRFFAAVADHWYNLLKPDGFRLDAVKHVPLAFWRPFNATCRERYGAEFFAVGELMEGDPRHIASTLRGGGFPSLFDYPLYYTLLDVFARGGSARQLGARMAADRFYPDPRFLCTFLDNHDLDRFLGSCGGGSPPDSAAGSRRGGEAARYRLALTWLLTARGIPTLCYGDEAGMAGTMEPDAANRADMPFGADPEAEALVRRLIALRRSSPALRRGWQEHLDMTDDSYAFARIAPDELAVVVFNLATASRDFSLAVPAGAAMGRVSDDLDSATALVTEGARDGGHRCEGRPASGSAITPEKRSSSLDGRGSFLQADGRLACRVAGQSAACFRLPGEFAEAAARAREANADPRRRGEAVREFTHTASGLAAGTEVLLIGSLPALGDWDPAKAPVMRPLGGNRFTCRLTLPCGLPFEYKFAYRHLGQVTWQEGGNVVDCLPLTPPSP